MGHCRVEAVRVVVVVSATHDDTILIAVVVVVIAKLSRLEHGTLALGYKRLLLVLLVLLVLLLLVLLMLERRRGVNRVLRVVQIVVVVVLKRSNRVCKRRIGIKGRGRVCLGCFFSETVNREYR